MNDTIETFLKKSGYSLHLYWHPDRQEWQAMLRDRDANYVASGFDAVLTTAIGVALLKTQTVSA